MTRTPGYPRGEKCWGTKNFSVCALTFFWLCPVPWPHLTMNETPKILPFEEIQKICADAEKSGDSMAPKPRPEEKRFTFPVMWPTFDEYQLIQKDPVQYAAHQSKVREFQGKDCPRGPFPMYIKLNGTTYGWGRAFLSKTGWEGREQRMSWKPVYSMKKGGASETQIRAFDIVVQTRHVKNDFDKEDFRTVTGDDERLCLDLEQENAKGEFDFFGQITVKYIEFQTIVAGERDNWKMYNEYMKKIRAKSTTTVAKTLMILSGKRHRSPRRRHAVCALRLLCPVLCHPVVPCPIFVVPCQISVVPQHFLYVPSARDTPTARYEKQQQRRNQNQRQKQPQHPQHRRNPSKHHWPRPRKNVDTMAAQTRR